MQYKIITFIARIHVLHMDSHVCKSITYLFVYLFYYVLRLVIFFIFVYDFCFVIMLYIKKKERDQPIGPQS